MPQKTHSKTSTADILGGSGQDKLPPVKWRKHHRRLLELREQLTDSKSNLVKDAQEEQPGFSLHMADAGSDHYDRDYALSMVSSEQNALWEIEQALRRIETGDYGICEITGEPIEQERLEAIPWARLSAKAQRELEASGGERRRGMGANSKTFEASDLGEGEAEGKEKDEEE